MKEGWRRPDSDGPWRLAQGKRGRVLQNIGIREVLVYTRGIAAASAFGVPHKIWALKTISRQRGAAIIAEEADRPSVGNLPDAVDLPLRRVRV